MKNILHNIGSAIAIMTGLFVGIEHGVWVGVSVGYALLLLVDIRKEVSR